MPTFRPLLQMFQRETGAEPRKNDLEGRRRFIRQAFLNRAGRAVSARDSEDRPESYCPDSMRSELDPREVGRQPAPLPCIVGSSSSSRSLGQQSRFLGVPREPRALLPLETFIWGRGLAVIRV